MPVRPLLVLAALALAAPLGAQQWRTVDVSRQLRDTTAHDVRIRYGAGSLEVRSTDDPVLFAMHLRYDEEAVAPVHRYDAADRRLTLGLGDASHRLGRHAKGNAKGELRLALSRQVPMNLDVEVGAAEARLDLGGLALEELKIETGASDSRVTFAQPNRVRMRRLDVSAGAANFRLTDLANARAEEIRIRSGVGNVDVDFGGPVAGTVRVETEMAFGRVLLVVPRDAGVRVELDRFLAGFSHFGLEKRGDAWYSENWSRAADRVDVHVKTAFGSVEIRRQP